MNALRRRLKPSPQKPTPQKSGDAQTSQTTLPQAAPSALSSTPAAVLPPPPKAPELPKTTERPKTTDRKFRTKTHRGTLAPQFNETFVEEGVLGSFPNLQAFHTRFAALPAIARFLSSDRCITFPCNNQHSHTTQKNIC